MITILSGGGPPSRTEGERTGDQAGKQIGAEAPQRGDADYRRDALSQARPRPSREAQKASEAQKAGEFQKEFDAASRNTDHQPPATEADVAPAASPAQTAAPSDALATREDGGPALRGTGAPSLTASNDRIDTHPDLHPPATPSGPGDTPPDAGALRTDRASHPVNAPHSIPATPRSTALQGKTAPPPLTTPSPPAGTAAPTQAAIPASNDGRAVPASGATHNQPSTALPTGGAQFDGPQKEGSQTADGKLNTPTASRPPNVPSVVPPTLAQTPPAAAQTPASSEQVNTKRPDPENLYPKKIREQPIDGIAKPNNEIRPGSPPAQTLTGEQALTGEQTLANRRATPPPAASVPDAAPVSQPSGHPESAPKHNISEHNTSVQFKSSAEIPPTEILDDRSVGARITGQTAARHSDEITGEIAPKSADAVKLAATPAQTGTTEEPLPRAAAGQSSSASTSLDASPQPHASLQSQTPAAPSVQTPSAQAPTIQPPASFINQGVERGGALAQVTTAIQVSVLNASNIEIRLDPPDLGRVTIDFSFDKDGGIVALLQSDNDDTSSLMRRHSEQLIKELSNAGFDDVKLEFSSEFNKQSGTDKGAQPRFSHPDPQGDDQTDTPFQEEHVAPPALQNPLPHGAHPGAGPLDIRL